jgi:hypothetical protein
MHDDPPPANDEDAPVDPTRPAKVAQLGELKLKHQDLDAAIHALELNPRPDQLQIARLKKQKLLLRDQITVLENTLTPDIIA